MPLIRCDLSEAVRVLGERDGVTSFAAVIDEAAGTLASLSRHAAGGSGGRERWLCVVGSEANGISQPVQAACDYSVRIPMRTSVDSLSITTAAAIALARLREAGEAGAAERSMRAKRGLASAVALAGAGAALGLGLGLVLVGGCKSVRWQAAK